MAVDTKFLNKFILPMFDEKTQPLINELFMTFEKEPGAAYNKCLDGFHHWLSQPNEHSTAVVNGLFFGVMIAALSEREDFREVFESCVEFNAKARGENVVNIFDRQIDKR